MAIPHEEAVRIEAALRTAQARSTGQIVCVLARASSSYEVMPLIWSALVALATPWPLLFLTEWSAERIFLIQLAVFLVALCILSLPALRLRLTPRSVRRANAHRAALEQFVLRGVTHCAERNGILIYVSLAEHYARIVADDGIASKVQQSVWQDAVDALLDRAGNGEVAEGFVIAVEKCGRVLAEHFPRENDDKDELPDRIYLI